MLLSTESVLSAIDKAAVGHSFKPEVRDMLGNRVPYAESVMSAVMSGDYLDMMSYREFDVDNSNGKRRHVEQPSLFTRVIQHLSIVLLKPAYDRLDPKISYNCKDGYGICASNPRKSLSRFLKRNVYDRTDLHYALTVDQRKCYGHMTRKVYRNALKMLTSDSELTDFAVNVAFHGNSFPIGTPTSPFAHHVIMLAFDRWLGSIPGPKARYADDTVIFFRTREEANAAKWRIINFWWYTYGLRAKRNPCIVDVDHSPLSFCGLVLRRNPGRTTSAHDKGYCRPRRNIRDRARKCRRDESYSSYFGLFSKTDSFNFLKSMEERMQFSELTQKIKIRREFDAQPISLPELARRPFNIYDFEVRHDKDGRANWVRLMVGMPELDESGEPTGKYLRYVVKTEADAIVQFMELARNAIDGVTVRLPFNNVEIENACGYMFKGSTDREIYCSKQNVVLPNSSVPKAEKPNSADGTENGEGIPSPVG